MEKSGVCKSCKRRELETDFVTGNIVCSYCGITQQGSDNFEHHFGGFNAPTGTFIRTGTSGSGTEYSFKQTKIYKAKQVLGNITSLLDLSDYSKDKVTEMFDEITEGEFGQGNWLPVCIGACTYVVMRKDEKPLSLSEVASKVGIDIHELGRMVKKVVAFLELKLPENDVVDTFEKGFWACFENVKIDKDTAKKMNKQGVFIVQCLVKWWVTTGRKPLPVVVAVLVFVAQLNDVDVLIENVAVMLHAVVSTCKKRYKELLERLVEVAKRLPWGKDVTVKNILKNAPFVIQYIELKSMSECNQKVKDSSPNLFDLDSLVGECLSKEVEYGRNSVDNAKNSQYFELKSKTSCPKWNSGNLDELKISHECLSMLYSEFSNEASDAEMVRGCERGSRRKRVDIFQCWDWWSGKSELSRKLVFKKILEKDIGFDMMPPSFVSGCLANNRRKEKIMAAKLRIAKIMNPLSFSLSENDKPFFVKCKSVGKRRRRIEVDTDWEDFIVETLLLHQVEEEEIEKGHYNTLMELYVFN